MLNISLLFIKEIIQNNQPGRTLRLLIQPKRRNIPTLSCLLLPSKQEMLTQSKRNFSDLERETSLKHDKFEMALNPKTNKQKPDPEVAPHFPVTLLNPKMT